MIFPTIKNNDNNIKMLFVTLYSILIMLSSFFFNSAVDIYYGLIDIISHPSILISCYLDIGNLGAAFFNSGLLMIIAIIIVKVNKVNINGAIIAAIFTLGGFAFFGKNYYNIWAIFIGVYLHSKYMKEHFSKYIIIALFGTALAPLVSQITFAEELPLAAGIILGNLTGILAGFILPPLANHLVKFHQGYSIYNIGFTAGIAGTLFMSFFRSFGWENKDMHIVAQGDNNIIFIYLIAIFISMIVLGYIFNDNSFVGYRKLPSRSGKLITDFTLLDNFGLTLINMGLLGIISSLYVIIIGGEISGPIIGGIFTIVGFGAFGKHIRNVIPILIGVHLSALIHIWEPTDIGALLAALFGTTLAPISGKFGWKMGILAGFIHMPVVMNIEYLQGGLNLYNNGFAGGIVAAVLVPIISALRKDELREE